MKDLHQKLDNLFPFYPTLVIFFSAYGIAARCRAMDFPLLGFWDSWSFTKLGCPPDVHPSTWRLSLFVWHLAHNLSGEDGSRRHDLQCYRLLLRLTKTVLVFGAKLSCYFVLFFQTFRHGFPFQPTAVAFDPIQHLLAVGTKSGSLRMYPFMRRHVVSPCKYTCTGSDSGNVTIWDHIC